MRGLQSRKIETNILNQNHGFSKHSTSQARTSRDIKIIKFTGDMKQNTTTLAQSINCKCGTKKDFTQIIHAYSDKITKLRQQRNKFKQHYFHQKSKSQQIHQTNKHLIQQINRLQSQIQQLKSTPLLQQSLCPISDPNQQLLQKIKQLQDQKHIIYSQYKQLQCNFNELNLQFIQAQHALNDKDNLLSLLKQQNTDSKNYEYQYEICLKQNQSLSQNILKYQQLLGMFNCSFDQLENVLNNHYNNMPQFQTQQERDLYQMATQMNADLWKKKVELEVKSIENKRMELRKMQEDLNHRIKTIK